MLMLSILAVTEARDLPVLAQCSSLMFVSQVQDQIAQTTNWVMFNMAGHFETWNDCSVMDQKGRDLFSRRPTMYYGGTWYRHCPI